MKKYYKIVSIKNGKFYSMVVRDSHHCSTIYKMDRFSHPKKKALSIGYGLTCFENKRIAMGYFGDGTIGFGTYKLALFECEIGMQMEPKPPWCVELGFWGADGSWWFSGTVMTNKIKLIKRVK